MRPVGVTTTGALQHYVYLRGLKHFRRPVIIGSETVSFSALWTLLRGGMRPVAMIEPERKCQFFWPSQYFPLLLGTKFYADTQIISINGIERVESVTVRSARGEEDIVCDGVLFTGMFTSENALIKESFLDLGENAVGPRVDQFLQCSDPAYFAAGNLLHPAEMGDRCFMEGRDVAYKVIDSLRNPQVLSNTRVDIKTESPITVVAPSCVTLGKGRNKIDLTVKAEPFVKGTLIFRQNGKELYRSIMRGHSDRFTRVKGFL